MCRFIVIVSLLLSASVSAKIPSKSARGKYDFLLIAGGDVAYPRGWISRLVERKGRKMYDDVDGYAKAADLAFVNLESPFTDKPFKLAKKWPIATPPHRLDWILDAGFNLLSLANNHMYDCGKEGIADTLELLKEKRKKYRNTWWAGAGMTPKEGAAPLIFRVPGKKVSVVFHAFGYAGSRLVPGPGKYSVELVRKYAKRADISIVSAHLGKEYIHIPRKRKARLFRQYIDAGADIVLGHHPHVVQGVEAYKSGIIIHSLGNFSFASKTTRHRKTGAKLYGILPLIYVKNKKVERVEVLPLWVNNSETWRLNGKRQPLSNMTPTVLKGDFAQKMLEDLRTWTHQLPEVHERAKRAFKIVGERAVIQVRR